MGWSNLGLRPEVLTVIGVAAAIHFGVVFVLWLIGLRHRNHSIMDVYWGFSFVIAVWLAWAFSDALSARGQLVLALVTIWASRLGYHLASRWARLHATGGDTRYQDIKENMLGGPWYNVKALFLLMWSQAALMVIAQLNMLLLIMTPQQAPLAGFDYVIAAVMLAAIGIETAADLQLDAFKANPANEGRVMCQGLWAWSRHPNYFANFLCFWCVFALSLQVKGLAWTVISPLSMSWILIGFTGKKWMDEHMRKRRPEYADYVRRTSGFVLLPPRR